MFNKNQWLDGEAESTNTGIEKKKPGVGCYLRI